MGSEYLTEFFTVFFFLPSKSVIVSLNMPGRSEVFLLGEHHGVGVGLPVARTLLWSGVLNHSTTLSHSDCHSVPPNPR